MTTSLNQIEQRLERIESLLSQLVTGQGAESTASIEQEIAMVKLQGKDLAQYFKDKAKKHRSKRR